MTRDRKIAENSHGDNPSPAPESEGSKRVRERDLVHAMAIPGKGRSALEEPRPPQQSSTGAVKSTEEGITSIRNRTTEVRNAFVLRAALAPV